MNREQNKTKTHTHKTHKSTQRKTRSAVRWTTKPG